MKRSLVPLLACALASPAAASAPIIADVLFPDASQLSVLGSITSVACVPAVSGSIDLGDISRDDLREGFGTSLQVRRTTLSVTCDRAAKVAVVAYDAQRSGAPDESVFVLTDGSGDRVVGGFLVSSGSFLLDGAAGIGMEWDGEKGYRSIPQTEEGPLHNLRMWPGRPVAFQFPNARRGEPSAFKTLSVDLNVRPWLEPRETFDATELVGIKGAVTFELLVL